MSAAISGELIPAPGSSGQPTKIVIDQAVWERIILDIASGVPVYVAVAQNGVSSRSFYRDMIFEPRREKEYARAKDAMHHAMADKIAEVAERPLIGERRKSTELVGRDADGNPVRLPAVEVTIGDNVERSKLIVDSLKWTLAKLLPRKYGDRTEQVVSLGDETIAAMERASARVIGSPQS